MEDRILFAAGVVAIVIAMISCTTIIVIALNRIHRRLGNRLPAPARYTTISGVTVHDDE